MAISPDQLAAVHKPAAKTPDKGKVPQPTPGSDWEVSFYRNDFLNIQGSEIGTDRRRRPTGSQEQERVTFAEPLRVQYRRFLHDYVVQLNEMRQRDPNILQGAFHIHDRMLLGELFNEETSAPDVEKINAFLGSNKKNWEIATVAMEHQAARLLRSVGAKAYLTPQGDRKTINDLNWERVQTGTDQGVINRVWNDTVLPFLTSRRDTVGGRPNPNAAGNAPNWQYVAGAGEVAAAAGLVGGAIGGPLGAAIGVGGVAGLSAAGAGIIRMTREGVVLNIEGQSAMLKSILNDPNEAKFMSQMTGINLEKYMVDAAGHVVWAPGVSHVHEFTKNPEQTLTEAIKLLTTRQEFFTTLGVSHKDLDEMNEQFLFGIGAPPAGNRLLIEQTGFRMHADIYSEFIRIGGLTPNVDVNIQRWSEARAKILEKSLKGEVDRIRKRKDRSSTIEVLGKHTTGVGESENKQKKEHTDEKDRLVKDKTNLEGEGTKIDAYRSKVESFRETREKKIIAARATLDQVLGSVRDAAGAGFPDTATALASLGQVLGVPGAPSVMVGDQFIQSVQQRIADARAARTAATRVKDAAAGETSQQYDRYLETFRSAREEDYRIAMEQVNVDVRVINETMRNLRTATTTPQVEITEDLSETNPVVIDAVKTLGKIQEDYTQITGWGLTNAQLTTETIFRLMRRINTANGWPSSQNKFETNRLRLINAMTEARARAISPVVAVPGAEFNGLTSGAVANGWEISEHQLLTFSPAQIRQLLIEKGTNPRFVLAMGLGIPVENTIKVAQDVTRQRLQARTQAVEQMETYLQTRADAEGVAAENVNLAPRKERGTIVENLMKNVGERLSAAREMASDPNRFFDPTVVNPVDPVLRRVLTDSERRTYSYTNAVGAVVVGNYNRGYLEIMNEIFKYRQEGDKIGKTFTEVSRIIPPDQLANFLDQEVGPRMVPPITFPPGRNDMTVVLTDARTLLNNGTIGWDQIQEVLERVAERLANVTIATKV